MKEAVVSNISYGFDQEPAIVSLIETAIKNSGKAGEVTDATPEHSAVSESASNGVAERTVQRFEDLPRTPKAALEARLRNLGSTALALVWPYQQWMLHLKDTS